MSKLCDSNPIDPNVSWPQENISKFEYGYWRTDKEKEPGFSHELISSDT
jgi:hypothetical protein